MADPSESSTDNEEISVQNLPQASFQDLFGLQFTEIKKIYTDAPENIKPECDLRNKNEVVAAVLAIRESLIKGVPAASVPNEKLAKSKELFFMSSVQLRELAKNDIPKLRDFMKAAISVDPSLKPTSIDDEESANLPTIVLDWKLGAAEKLVRRQIREVRQQAESSSNQGGVPVPVRDDPPPNAQSNAPPDLFGILNTMAGAHQRPTAGPGGAKIPSATPGQPIATLGDIQENRNILDNPLAQSFRKPGTTTPGSSYLLHQQYVGRLNSSLVLRVNERIADQILTGLLQEGHSSLEQLVRQRQWSRTATGEPFLSEAEALTLARILHLNLMMYSTVQQVLDSCPWMETALRRLYAILHVERFAAHTQRPALWRVASAMCEVYPEMGAKIPALDKMLSQEATLQSKRDNAYKALEKGKGSRKRKKPDKKSKGKTKEKEE